MPGQTFPNSCSTQPPLFPDSVKPAFYWLCGLLPYFPVRIPALGATIPFPSRRVARAGREEAGLRLTRGGKAPTPGVGGGVQSWPSPKGPPLLRRSLRPALLSPAPLSGVRARAGAGRGYELQDLGGGWGGVSPLQHQKLGRVVLKGPSLFPSEAVEQMPPCPL